MSSGGDEGDEFCIDNFFYFSDCDYVTYRDAGICPRVFVNPDFFSAPSPAEEPARLLRMWSSLR